MFRNIGPASGMVEGVKCTLATLTTQRNGPNLHTLIHSAVVLRRDKGAGASHSGFSERKQGVEVGLPKRSGSLSIKFPTLRFRAKIMLGFTVTLAISAASMGIAYMGFERVSSGVDVYRRSVREADLARNIDRELISYRSLARYFVVTGKEDGARIAQNQLTRSGMSLHYKLDDLPSNADEAELQVISLGSKKVYEQFQSV